MDKYRRCANDVTDVKEALAAMMVISRKYQKIYFLIEENVFSKVNSYCEIILTLFNNFTNNK